MDWASYLARGVPKSNIKPLCRLTYWDGRGNAEIIRLMLSATGEAWEEKVYGSDDQNLHTFDQFRSISDDGALPFEQLPLLQIDGLNLVQKFAIVRYLARKHRMYGSNDAEAVKCDIIMEGLLDWKASLKYNDFGETFQAGLRKYMPKFVRILGTNKFLVGATLTFVDVVLLEVLLFSKENGVSFEEWPSIDALFARVSAVPGIASYLASPRRYPFPGNEGYMSRVSETIPWVFGKGPPPAMTSPVWNFRSVGLK